MEKVAGIGGVFFRAADPDALRRWYQEHLGVSATPRDYGQPPWQQAGPTVFEPFPADTTYFGRADQGWMINFSRARSRGDGCAASGVRAGCCRGIRSVIANGRFARLHDPECNPVELWEPRDARGSVAGTL